MHSLSAGVELNIMNKINLIMPMCGFGSRFTKCGFDTPKPLIKLFNKPFFYWSITSIANFVNIDQLICVVLKDHVERYSIDKVILEFFPCAEFIILEDVPNGALLTCMEGAKFVNNNFPIIFNDCDHYFRAKLFYDYCNNVTSKKYDALLLTFNSSDKKYSYAQVKDGFVQRVVEKEVVSNHAICGAYYFRNKKIFYNYCTKLNYVSMGNGELYISYLIDIMAKDQDNTKVGSIEVENHISFGTPAEYNDVVRFKRNLII